MTNQAVRIRIRLPRSGYINTWMLLIYLCLLISIKHNIFCFSTIWMVKKIPLNIFWHARLYQSGYIKTWMSWIYLCLLNSIKHHSFCFIYHLDGQRDTIKQFLTDQAVLTPVCSDFMPCYIQCLKCLCLSGKSPIFTMLSR